MVTLLTIKSSRILLVLSGVNDFGFRLMPQAVLFCATDKGPSVSVTKTRQLVSVEIV